MVFVSYLSLFSQFDISLLGSPSKDREQKATNILLFWFKVDLRTELPFNLVVRVDQSRSNTLPLPCSDTLRHTFTHYLKELVESNPRSVSVLPSPSFACMSPLNPALLAYLSLWFLRICATAPTHAGIVWLRILAGWMHLISRRILLLCQFGSTHVLFGQSIELVLELGAVERVEEGKILYVGELYFILSILFFLNVAKDEENVWHVLVGEAGAHVFFKVKVVVRVTHWKLRQALCLLRRIIVPHFFLYSLLIQI